MAVRKRIYGLRQTQNAKDILGMSFFIPNYQRGYRWKEQQVIDLLEDIYSFSLNHTDQSEEIYCKKSDYIRFYTFGHSVGFVYIDATHAGFTFQRRKA